MPGVSVVIANPDTLGQCSDSQLGEIWVSSPHNSIDLMGPFDSTSLLRIQSTTSAGQFIPSVDLSSSLNARLATGDTGRVYARTGYLGFVRRTDLTQSDGGECFMYLFLKFCLFMFLVGKINYFLSYFFPRITRCYLCGWEFGRSYFPTWYAISSHRY